MNIPELKAKAEAATPGPWRQIIGGKSGPMAIVTCDHADGYQLHNMEDVRRTDPDVWPHMKETYRRDAAFLATDPPRVRYDVSARAYVLDDPPPSDNHVARDPGEVG